MRKKQTIIVGLIAFVGAVYFIANITLSNFLSQERLRLMLIEPVQDQLGRQVEIGAIKVSLFSGIDIQDIVVKEKNPAQDFVTIDTFRLKYELLPLFEKRLVIKEVLVDRPTINVIRDAQGAFNFADLSLKPKKIQKDIPPPELQTVEPLPLTLIFDLVRVNDLNLTFKDQSGALPAITSTDGDLSLSVTLGNTLPEAKYQGTLDLIVNTEFRGRKPVLILKSEVSEQMIAFKGELSVEFDRLLFNGQFANLKTAPELTFDLEGPSLDVGRLAGFAQADQRTAPRSVPATQTSAKPQPAGSDFRAHGKIEIGEVRRDKLTLQNLKLDYNWAGQTLQINNLTAGLFGGSISGKVGLELGQAVPAFKGQLKADKLQMGNAMEALGKPAGTLTGTMSGNVFGRGRGSSWPVIRDNLEGQARITVTKGAVAGSPLSRALAALLGLPELENLKFDKLAAIMTVTSGLASLDAGLSAQPLSVQTKGNVGMDGSLDLPLVIQLSQENSRRLQEKASFARYLADDSGRTTLHLKLKGTVDHPDLSLSNEGTGSQIKNALGKKASEELSRSLSKKLGGLDEQNQQAVGESADQLLRKLLGN